MRTREEAIKEVERLGMTRMALHWEEAIEIAMRGWPAWRIAQHYQFDPKLIHALGGPAFRTN